MTEVLLGISLGWAAGISPGPLFALVITTSLRQGFAAGARIATVPLISDLPVVVIALAAVSALSDQVVTWLSVVGGLYLVYLGISEIRAAGRHQQPEGPEVVAAARDIGRGVLVNLLSPHPWLFWIAVGGPIVTAAWRQQPWSAVGFVATFYLLLVGSKILLALVVARGGQRLGVVWRTRLAMLGGGLIGVTGLFLLGSELL